MGIFTSLLKIAGIMILALVILSIIFFFFAVDELSPGGDLRNSICADERNDCYNVCDDKIFFKGSCKSKCEEQYRLCRG